ncbi:trypsin-like peptidase domain-containing protein [Microbacterium sp. STN6]|uniref:S1C family serine protease n=1 Tax=Microbacterium sp. STN6 TaxID=2995588 RepID=UPI002260EFED|nr:trypsin-like peptidase domain-containing protein [Microbacterium sp. STN6]MCX7521661.1 trypsin-like peptidase domain-containing protein [Microbacterium sp. STN6]
MSARTARRVLATGAALALAGALAACTGMPNPAPAATSEPPAAPQVAAPTSASLAVVPEVVKQVEPSVVTITTPIGLGSGVIYRSDGTIVTDAHVVENEQKRPFDTVQVQFADGAQAQASVIAVDDTTDVAVIKAKRKGLPAATFAKSEPEVGELAIVLGSPLGLDETVTAGIISGLHRNMPASSQSPQGLIDLIQTDAPISPGNSGGAVVNGQAQVVGLSEAYLPPSSGAVAIGFVTPSTTVTDVADQLLKSGKASHAFLGVVCRDITPQLADQLELSKTEGALVIQVQDGSPAASAGIKPGDIITKVGDRNVHTVLDLVAAVRAAKVGHTVTITDVRGKKSLSLQATLVDQQ